MNMLVKLSSFRQKILFVLTPGGNVVYILKQNVFWGGRTEVLGPWVNRGSRGIGGGGGNGGR